MKWLGCTKIVVQATGKTRPLLRQTLKDLTTSPNEVGGAEVEARETSHAIQVDDLGHNDHPSDHHDVHQGVIRGILQGTLLNILPGRVIDQMALVALTSLGVIAGARRLDHEPREAAGERLLPHATRFLMSGRRPMTGNHAGEDCRRATHT